jgi:hypothetical protein
VDSHSTLPGVTQKAVTGVVRYSDEGYYDTLDRRAVVYPSQHARYHAEGCMALGSDSSV